MQINEKKVVTLSYVLSVLHPDGVLEKVDERSEHNPIEFVFGRGLLLPSVEKELHGQSKGFQVRVKVAPQEAFGVRNEDLVLVYPISKLPKNIQLQVGMKFQTQGPKGDPIAVIVKEVSDNNVVLDGNHPLADAYLQFDLHVLKVRDATEEELRRGEVLPQRIH